MLQTPAAAPPPCNPGRSLQLLDRLTRRSSIRGILLVILVVALLPMMALSTWQGLARIQRDRDAEHRKLLEAAQLTAASQRNVITGAQTILAVLAAAPNVRARDQDMCGPILRAAVQSQPVYRHFSVSTADGRLACASDPGAIGVAATSSKQLWDQVQRSGFLVTAPVWGTISERLVLRAMLPLKTATGAFDGVITASIDLDWLRQRLHDQHPTGDIAVALVDGRGTAVASNRALPARRLKVTQPNESGVFTVRSADGRDWAYAVAPLHVGNQGGERFHIVYAAAQPPRFGSQWWSVAFYFLVPLLALLLASMAIWVGANRAILNWVSQLGSLARQIGNSQRPHMQQRLGFADAPAEVRDLAADLLRMRSTIVDREQSLRGAAAAQTEVARELHHRVRNNLQVIASFLSLQAETIAVGDARNALEQARLRVAGMAMVNGLLYADAEVTTVAMAQLLDPLADMLARHTGVEAIVEVNHTLSPRAVDVDRAIPLVLWIIEATLCLCERADPSVRPNEFRIAMNNEDDVMCIHVCMAGLLPDSAKQTLHRRLVVAIANQQGASARIDDVGAKAGRIVLRLPHEALAHEAQELSEAAAAT